MLYPPIAVAVAVAAVVAVAVAVAVQGEDGCGGCELTEEDTAHIHTYPQHKAQHTNLKSISTYGTLNQSKCSFCELANCLPLACMRLLSVIEILGRMEN